MTTLRPQFVNLYQKHAGWKARILKARGAAIGLALLVAGLTLLTIFSAVSMRLGENAARQLTAVNNERQASLHAAVDKYQLNDDFRKLQLHVQQLQWIIARQDAVLSRLRDTDLNPAASFSSRLDAIAEAHIDGVWLTQMDIQSTPASLKLTGVALDADLLPRYLAQLGSKARLGVRQLDSLTLERSVNDPRALQAGAVGFNLLLQNADERGPS